MLTRFILALFIILVLGCSKDEEGEWVEVVRGENQYPAVRVTRAPKGYADRLLFEWQGYVEASDRFIQMDFLRRTARGTLAEILGEKWVEGDAFVRAVGVPLAINRSTEKLNRSAEFSELVRSFVSGVNRFIEEIPSKRPELLKFYRNITLDPNYLPARWELEDSIAIKEMIAFHLSSSLEEKLGFGALYSLMLSRGEEDDFINYLDMRPLSDIAILKVDKEASPLNEVLRLPPGIRPNYRYALKDPCQEFPTRFPLGGCKGSSYQGSNNWVVSRSFAGGGHSLLANDPHLLMTFPATFYEMALDSKASGGTFKVRGVNLPGLPGILIGHNEKIGWGFTNSMSDVDDVYFETLNPTGTQVIYKGSEVPMGERIEPILVRRSTGSIEVKETKFRWIPHHGPIVSDHLPGFQRDRLFPNTALSYRWTGHEGGNELTAILGVNRSSNFNEFKAALSQYEVGAQNMVYADTEGNIGYYSHGRFPIRRYLSKELPPHIPVPGQGKFEWSGYREEFPELYNPPGGKIVTANNDPFGYNSEKYLSDFKDYFGYGFSSGLRAKRISDLLDERRGKLTLAEMARVQFDHRDLFALKYVDLAKRAGLGHNLGTRVKKSFESLSLWSGDTKRDRNEPVLFYAWFNSLLKHHYEELIEPKLFTTIAGGAIGARTVYHKLNDLLLTHKDKVKEILSETLAQAVLVLEKEGLSKSHWGEVHRLKLFSPLSGFFPTVTSLPLERDGSFDTVDVGGFSALNDDGSLPTVLPTMYGPNFRLVMAFRTDGEPIEAINVLAGGCGAKLNDPLVLDEWLMWREGRYRGLVPFAK